MAKLDISEMQNLQRILQEKYKDVWAAVTPEEGRNKLLWMIAECGEASQIIKKKGENAIMNDKDVRKHFVEELCDVMMYFNDILNCFSVTPEEFENAYLEKHTKNLNRW